MVQPDGEFLHFLHLGSGEDVLDALKVVGECGENLAFEFFVLFFEKLGIDLDRPALEFFHDRVVKLFFLVPGHRLAKRTGYECDREYRLFDHCG